MKTHLKITFAALSMAAAVSCSAPTETARMDRSRLNIGTYYLQPYARTEAHVKDLAECGIDFVIGMPDDTAILDIFDKYGVGAIVSNVAPSWWGGGGERAGQLEATNPPEKYIEAAWNFKDHPAIWGIDIGDEPSALDFPYYGKVFTLVDSLFPESFPYLNLYPNYASVAKNDSEQTVNQLGTRTYAEHISQYCLNVPSDYICYDFYLYSIGVPRAYMNLKTVADACRATGRSMWIVLQVNSLFKEKWISADNLRFQAYTAMAHGAEVITWACYTAGWWHNQVLDSAGVKTEQYDKLKEVNAELHAFSDTYMKYRNVSTSFVGFHGTDWLGDANQVTVDAFSHGSICGLAAEDGSPLVVGEMESRDGHGCRAVFVMSADDPYGTSPKDHVIRFAAPAGARITDCSGTACMPEPKDGIYEIALGSNRAIIIEL